MTISLRSTALAALPTALLLALSLTTLTAHAQKADDVATQNAIIAALPKGVTADKANTDEIAQAAIDLAFRANKEKLETTVAQVMVSLGELTKAGKFPNAPRFGENNPAGRFYIKVMNLASSNLDVSSSTYYGLTVQDMTRLSAAAHEGMNFLNGAKSKAITRK